MDFELPKEDDPRRLEVRAWFEARPRPSGRELAEAGYATPHWPRPWGLGADAETQLIVDEEMKRARVTPPALVNPVAINNCAQSLLTHGTDAQRERFLMPALAGEEIWCMLFSEPAGGSDLAGLRTRAEAAADGAGDWIIDGQKIWTSGAHYSDMAILITRTDPTVPKHKGLTMFFLSMKPPGVEIRPIKQANGDSGFNEVYFTEGRLPDAQRRGAVGDGWKVSLTTLMNERLSIGAGMSTGFPELFDLCCRIETANGLAVDDPAVRQKLATWAVRTTGLKYTGFRALSALSRGETPGPENSIGKLVAGSSMQEIAMFAEELMAQAGILTDPELTAASGRFQRMLLRSPATRVEGGTDEILRNIIAERVLGLPQDIRLDKDVAFKDIPSGR